MHSLDTSATIYYHLLTYYLYMYIYIYQSREKHRVFLNGIYLFEKKKKKTEDSFLSIRYVEKNVPIETLPLPYLVRK